MIYASFYYSFLHFRNWNSLNGSPKLIPMAILCTLYTNLDFFKKLWYSGVLQLKLLQFLKAE